MKCGVCGKYFIPKKENVYLVAEKKMFSTQQVETYDAIDCPRCGCQKVLKLRMDKVEQDGDTE